MDLTIPLYVNSEFHSVLTIKHCPTMFQRFKQALVSVMNKVDKTKKHSLYTLKKTALIIECEDGKVFRGAHMLEQAMRFNVVSVKMTVGKSVNMSENVFESKVT